MILGGRADVFAGTAGGDGVRNVGCTKSSNSSKPSVLCGLLLFVEEKRLCSDEKDEKLASAYADDAAPLPCAWIVWKSENSSSNSDNCAVAFRGTGLCMGTVGAAGGGLGTGVC